MVYFYLAILVIGIFNFILAVAHPKLLDDRIKINCIKIMLMSSVMVIQPCLAIMNAVMGNSIWGDVVIFSAATANLIIDTVMLSRNVKKKTGM